MSDEPVDEATRPQALATVVDRDRLDAADAKSGIVPVAVLGAWLERRGTLVVDVPKRVKCASCGGGGCGLCGNTGAFRTATTSLRIDLEPSTPEAKRIRVSAGLGEGTEVDLLLLELQPSTESSAFARFEERLAPVVALAPTNDRRTAMLFLIAVLLALTLVVALLVTSYR